MPQAHRFHTVISGLWRSTLGRTTAPSRSQPPRSRFSFQTDFLELLEARSLLSRFSGFGSARAPRPAHLVQVTLVDTAERGFTLRQSNLVRPTATRATVLRNIVYDKSDQRKLDIYLPAGREPTGGWPVVLAIHGGGWRRFSKDSYGAKIASLSSHGYVVVAPNYALSTSCRASWPENFEDIRESVRWIRENARRYSLDAERIAAIGESAGGHLAALLGTLPDDRVAPTSQNGSGFDQNEEGVSTRIQAVISFFGPTDLEALTRESRGAAFAIRQLLGARLDDNPAPYEAASPVSHVSRDDAPMLLIHGTKDTLVPISQARILARGLSRAGVPNRVIEIPGASHGFGFQVAGRNLLPDILAFLKESLPA